MKDFRVKELSQLIFHGTPSLKPLSLAEVTLTLENTDNMLPIDYAEVSVTRRIGKDNVSEYFINKNKCALKDINNLFMGSGIGKSAYSIMRQGAIDDILKRKPEERREIFEEAAGILKYRNRRRETERDLEKAEANLKQVRPTMIEVERQYQSKKKQAERAEKYNKLNDKKEEIEVDINLFKIRDLKASLEEKKEIQDKLQKKKLDTHDTLKELEKQIDDTIQKSQDLQQTQHSVQTEILQHEGQVVAIRQKISMLEDKKQSIEKNINNWQEAVRQNTEKIGKIHSSIEEIKKEQQNIGQMIIERQDNLEKYAQDITEINKIIEENSENIRVHKKKIEVLQTDQEQARVKQEEVINRLVEAIDQRKAELMGSAELKQDLKTSISHSLEEIQVFLRNKKDMLDDLINLDFMKHSEKDRVAEILDGFRKGLEEKVIGVEELKEQFSRLDNLIAGFDEIIFAREGIHAQKEDLDKQLVDLIQDEKSHRERIRFLETDIKNQQTRIETIKQMMHESQLNLVRMREQSRSFEENIETQTRFFRDVETQNKTVQANIEEAYIQEKVLTEEISNTKKSHEDQLKGQEVLKVKLSAITKDLSSVISLSSNKDKKAHDLRGGLENLHEKIDKANRDVTTYEIEIRSIYDNFYQNYSIDLHSHEENITNKKFDMAEMRTELKKIKEEIKALGQINYLAVDEYRELEERFKLLSEQIDDIEKSKKNLEAIIKEINKNSEEIFHQTFNRIKINFHKLFRRLFDGGKAELILTDPENILESGVEIKVQPPSKALQTVALLSGGESSMTAIALLFSIFMVKPSPFCILDEIDAALDGPNVERFKKLLMEFSNTTQFLMISHNINTLKSANAIYGVSMEEDGVSTAISLDMKQLEKLKKKYIENKK